MYKMSESSYKIPMAFSHLKHAQRQRIEYLDRLLFWRGAATRSSLMERFGISNPQAALDFKTYLESANFGALKYDKSSKQYLTTEDFSRLTGEASAIELEEMLDCQRTSLFEVVPDLYRTHHLRVFQLLFQALIAQDAVQIVYQSMRQPEPESRWIAPVRFASDGIRLHLRAWCYTHDEYRDFVPSRIDLNQSFLERRSALDIPNDEDWFTWSILTLRPHHSLTPGQQRVVRTEFGFVGDFLEVRVRKALEFYTKHRWGLELDAPRLECVDIKHVEMTEKERKNDKSSCLSA